MHKLNLLLALSLASVCEPVPAFAAKYEGTTPPVVDVHAVQLLGYTVTALRSWPAPDPSVPQADLAAIAADIVQAEREEGPIWPDDLDGSRTVAMLGALGFFEGARFAAYVDDGSCNRWMRVAWSHGGVAVLDPHGVRRYQPDLSLLDPEARRLLRFGHCDGGEAYSIWQVHPLTWQSRGRVERFTAERLGNRLEAARAALLIARSSVLTSGTLNGYTGEGTPYAVGMAGPPSAWAMPKARLREQFAADYVRRHPFAPLP